MRKSRQWHMLRSQVTATPSPHKRLPGNKGKLTGAKPPLRSKHVWSIWTKLQIEGRAHDLAMFNLAINSKLRSCAVVAIRVEDVAGGGYTADRATIRQRKTVRPVKQVGSPAYSTAKHAGLKQETFVILPHAQVLGYMCKKIEHYDR